MMLRIWLLLLFYSVLAHLAIEDFRKRKISDRCHGIILLLAFAAVYLFPEISLRTRFLGMFVVSVPMIVLALSVPGSFGGGDVKMVFSCGAFLGWRLVLQGTILAIFFAGCYSFWLLFIKRESKTVQFALGPYLSLGFFLSSISLL